MTAEGQPMFDDFDWERAAAERRRAEAEQHERQRHALATLLAARKQREAAAIVTISGWTVVETSSYGEGSYAGRLAVPPAAFDFVNDAMKQVLDDAAAAVI